MNATAPALLIILLKDAAEHLVIYRVIVFDGRSCREWMDGWNTHGGGAAGFTAYAASSLWRLVWKVL